MRIVETGISGLKIVEPKIFGDDRGYFFESYNKRMFDDLGLEIDIVQTNVSKSTKGVVRGLHFQNPPCEQGKLIRVLKGAVLDVVVDIRKSSSTFGKSFQIELNDTNKYALWVPKGFAHGFKTLEDNTLFYYDCTGFYNKAAEGSIRWNDPQLNINWGIENPVLSEKDENAPLFSELQSQFD